MANILIALFSDIKDLADEAADLRSKYETCEQVYLWACRKLGCTPVTPFIRNINQELCNLGTFSITFSSYKLLLDDYGLGERGTKALSVSLIINTSIIRLQLASNAIGGNGTYSICNMLKENCFITELVLGKSLTLIPVRHLYQWY